MTGQTPDRLDRSYVCYEVRRMSGRDNGVDRASGSRQANLIWRAPTCSPQTTKTAQTHAAKSSAWFLASPQGWSQPLPPVKSSRLPNHTTSFTDAQTDKPRLAADPLLAESNHSFCSHVVVMLFAGSWEGTDKRTNVCTSRGCPVSQLVSGRQRPLLLCSDRGRNATART